MEKKEPSYTVGGNVSWYRHYGEQYGGSVLFTICVPLTQTTSTTRGRERPCKQKLNESWYSYINIR